MDQNEGLFNAAGAGDLDELRRMVEAGADLNAHDEDGLTPLCYAALTDQVATAEYLIGAGADPYQDSSRAFDTACGQGATRVSRLLFGLQTRSQPDLFGTPLHAAALLGLEDRARALLTEGIDVNRRDHHAQAAIHFAFTDLFHHLLHRVRLILETREPGFALSDRFVEAAEEAARRLRRLAYGERLSPDLRVKDPLRMAALLVEHGADVNPGGSESPLSLAVRQGNLEAADYLIANGAEALTEIGGRNLIHIAAHEGQAEVIPFLLERGLVFDQQDDWGWTPLHSAAWMGHLEAARVLLDNGANKALRNQQGRPPNGEVERRIASEITTRDYLSSLVEAERELRQRFFEQLDALRQLLS